RAELVGAVGIFFFSSRRRHTSFDCDWSSDVCSSDLVRDLRDARRLGPDRFDQPLLEVAADGDEMIDQRAQQAAQQASAQPAGGRSEERRVGKECRWWWGEWR